MILYKLMSYWFVELLVVIFCIGGVEVPTFSVVFFFFASSQSESLSTNGHYPIAYFS